ncbi:TVA4 protein, partial [Casuarius casuarius]|nr:TVA4 protein [Casuarius casuarius]
SFLVAAAGRAQVRQELLAEATEGAGISITCSHPNIQTSNLIHWYWQLPGRGPTFITSVFKEPKEVRDPPGTLLVAADCCSNALQLARPRWWDAAVYYWAVGD